MRPVKSFSVTQGEKEALAVGMQRREGFSESGCGERGGGSVAGET